MYRHFYGLEELPFNITPDSRFLYLSQRHKEALAALMYGVKQRKGFIALTGEIGSGKTTICRAFLKDLDPEQNKVAIILNSFLTEVELLQAINQEFGLPAESQSKKILIDNLNAFLLKEHALGNNIIIIIDEAQNLMPPVLEQIRMLSNLETETDKLLQIILIGQPELELILQIPELEQLNQRISVRYHITPLTTEEIGEYIQYRLKIAKAKVKIDFSQNALNKVFNQTCGIPRKINLLCDRILLIGYVEGTTKFNEEIVERAAKEIHGGLKNKAVPPIQNILNNNDPITIKTSRQISSLTPLVYTMIILIFIFISGIVGVIIAYKKIPYPQSESEEIKNKITQTSSETLETIGKSKETNYIKEGIGEEKNIVSPENKTDENKVEQSADEKEEVQSETPIPTPTKTPKPKEKIIFKYALQYDDNGIVRINDPELAYQACLLSWLYLWGITVDLAEFQKYPLELIKKFDLAVQNEKLGLRKFEFTWKITDIVKYDIPVILKLNPQKEKLTRAKQGTTLCDWVLLRKIEGKSCTIIDPVYSFFIVNRDTLQDAVEKVFVPYFDKDNFILITKGENSERIKKLQEILSVKGFYKEKPSSIFDKNTEKAVKSLQKNYGLKETGAMDIETVIIICAQSVLNRPRLYSE